MSVVRREGRIEVDEVWLAIDAGRIVNPDRVRSQMEGSVVFGLNLAFFGGPTMKGGVTQQSNFHDLPLVRLHQVPKRLHVELVDSVERPGGVGEPGAPPIAPALANAVFALTGQRLRSLPMREALGL